MYSLVYHLIHLLKSVLNPSRIVTDPFDMSFPLDSELLTVIPWVLFLTSCVPTLQKFDLGCLSLIFGTESQDWLCEHHSNVRMRFPSAAWPFPGGELPSQRRKLDRSFIAPALKIHVARLSSTTIWLFMRFLFFYCVNSRLFSRSKVKFTFFLYSLGSFLYFLLIAFLKLNSGFHLPPMFLPKFARIQTAFRSLRMNAASLWLYRVVWCISAFHLIFPYFGSPFWGIMLSSSLMEVGPREVWSLHTWNTRGKIFFALGSSLRGWRRRRMQGCQRKDGGPTREVAPRCPIQASCSTHTHFFLQIWGRLDHEHFPDAFACFWTPRDAARYPITYYFYSGKWFSSYTEC